MNARKDNITTTGMVHMAKPATKPLQRLLYVCAQEEETLNELIKAEEEKRINKLRHEKEEKIARELQEQREKIDCENARRIHLRNTVPELRNLASQLRAAYVGKMQACQRMENQKRAEEEKNTVNPYVMEMKELWKEQDRKAMEDEEKKWIEKRKLFKTLRHQLDNNPEKQMLEEERKNEREEIDRIIKLTSESLRKQKEEDRQKKKEAYYWYLEHLKAKDVNNEKQNEIEEIEKNKRELYKTEVLNREDTIKRKRKEALDKAAKLQHKLASELGSIQKAEYDRQQQCQEFSELLLEMKNSRLTDEDFLKKKRLNEELSHVMNMQMEEKRQRQEAERRTELEYRAMLEKSAKEEAERRKKFGDTKKAKMRKYRQELEKCEADRNKRLFEHNERELREVKAMEDEHADYLAQVEQERKAMIREMAPHLMPGCIGRKVLRKSDVDSLSPLLRDFVESKPIWPPRGEF